MHTRILAVLGLLCLFVLSFGQTSPNYKIRPDDVLRIQIFDEQQVNSLVVVGSDGRVAAPFIGVVQAEGLTVTELTATLTREYERVLRIRAPKVSVTIERFAPLRASVVDLVNRPGVFDIRPTDTLLDLLSYGGGPVLSGERRADLRRATLRRKGSREVIPIDLYALLRYGDMTQNYVVEDGDILTVPEDKFSNISILGQVPRPGTFAFRDGMTLSDALALGGGAIDYRGNLGKVIVARANLSRPGEYIRIIADFNRYVKKGDSSQNIKLQAGDLVYVSESNQLDLNRFNQIINSVANGLFILDRFGLGFLPRR